MNEINRLYNPGQSNSAIDGQYSVSKPIDSIQSSVQKITKTMPHTTKNRVQRTADDTNASPRGSVEQIGVRMNTGQVTFGRNAQ